MRAETKSNNIDIVNINAITKVVLSVQIKYFKECLERIW